jgi:chromosomal replication initiator protein
MPNHDLSAIWGGVKDNLRRHMESGDYELWIAKTRLLEVNEMNARVEAPDELHAAYLDNNYAAQVQNALELSFGSRRSVVFESSSTEHVLEQPELFGDGVAEDGKTAKTKSPKLRPAVGFFNELYSFDSFVVGSNNEFAAAACQAVAKNPAKTYNPLFIFGPTGMGKTHLMHAIGRQILINRPKSKIICVTSEDFTNEFIAAIGNSSLPAFRKKYRQADVLLIDDVQFFGDKGRSQEEFFHTFNSFQDGHKQIVLTCDSMPSEINGLEKRLMSRFEWGMTAAITPPEVETRMAILRRKLQSLKNVPYLSDEIVRFVAEKVRSNVRRLQGAILRVVTYYSLNPELVLSPEIVATKILPDLLHEEAKDTVNVDRIQKVTADYFSMEISDLTGPRRPADIAWARQLAMYLTRELTKSAYQDIGRAFGNRDHGTVMHACRKVEEKNNVDEKATADLRFLLRELQR